MTASSPEVPATTGEIRALTGMRGIAAWWVVLYHVRGSIAGLPPFAERILAKGYLAVDFFFLLSGFVIWLAWKDRLPGRTATFLMRRVARIWPLHLAMLALTVALAGLLDATGRSDASFPWGELPLHLLLVQNWGSTTHLAWNDPAWSISAELAAYLLFPLLVLAVDWRGRSTATLIALATGALVALHLVMLGQPGLGADIPRFGLARCLIEFGVGTIVAALWVRHPGRPGVAALSGALLLAAWASGAPETLVVPAAFAALLLALASGDILSGRTPHFLGEISYATYLSHFLFWKIFKLAFVSDAAAVSLPMIAAYLIIVLAASAVLYHGLERPAQRWINVLGDAWLSRPVRRPALRSGPR